MCGHTKAPSYLHKHRLRLRWPQTVYFQAYSESRENFGHVVVPTFIRHSDKRKNLDDCPFETILSIVVTRRQFHLTT